LVAVGAFSVENMIATPMTPPLDFPPDSSSPPTTIWTKSRVGAEETFLRVRKSFVLEDVPPVAIFTICTTARYVLWCNGARVARGPAHSGTSALRYDEIDLASHLRQGLNTVALQLIRFDYFTAQSEARPPGMRCELRGPGLHLVTDSSWKTSPDEAYVLPSFRRNSMFGPQEIFDARKEEDWQNPRFDDSAWTPAEEMGNPWPDLTMIPRGIPQVRETMLRPTAVARVAEVLDQEHFPQMWNYRSYRSLAVSLLQDVPEAPRLSHVEGAGNLVEGARGIMKISQPWADDRAATERRCATVVFDFGREIDAYVWLDVEGGAGTVIDIACGEELTAGRVQAMRQGTHYADRFILREGRQRHEVYDWKGFRYLQMTFRNLTRPLCVHELGAVFCSYPVEPAGGFQANDPLLGEIWMTGAYTQQLCMHDRLMDCPWREQVQWLGDGRLQLLVIQSAFGDPRIMRKFVEDFAHSQRESGLIPGVSCRHNESLDISDYALWWLVALHDVASWDGDPAWTQSMLPHAGRLLDYFEGFVGPRGLLEDVPGWLLIEWAPLGRSGCVASLNAIYHMALSCAGRLHRWAGDSASAARAEEGASRIAAAFHQRFWSEADSFYIDCIASGDGQAEGRLSVHTQALAVLAGLSRTDSAELLTRALADNRLARTEPFFSFYLLEAMSVCGLGGQAADFVREKWGRMIKAGASTFWEEWQTGGTFRDGVWAARPRSYCHAWSAGPTAWLSRHVLGLRREAPGTPLLFAPQTCGLREARGTVPTNLGNIAVNWSVVAGTFHAELTLPHGCDRPVFIPPKEFSSSSTIDFKQGPPSEEAASGGFVRSQ
jgi:hypothetical protein